MASRRTLLVLSLRAPACSIARPCIPAPWRAIGAPAPRAAAVGCGSVLQQGRQGRQGRQVRWHSTGVPKSKVYEFDDVKKIVESPDEGVVLVDVREPAEYAAGFIPSAINIPVSSQPEALFLPPDEFEDRFGFTKPPASNEVVFYCKSGVRSAAAAQLARQGGYEKVGEYRGSWLDWERRGGASSKDERPGDKEGGIGESRV